ncbi:MAG: hypothetical protein GTN67_11325 [Hydrotalea flava]|uniref:fatty acid desaturase n=1 Tax=Hydrotalea flava TaxID=714549 RepID=UPI000FA99F0D|nr:fatty acid desaturase [Hydrotalea flava]RTL47272.1 MAG: hypothetical protein EKK39_14655 [Sphingobacteriales bacterium]NIM35946.1 hypothetical protein [Hydrotalea flava]NIM38779.1 hypothetical protein [Hydrotalea flava]NIN03967.1 hypothetical protein [Hydrotalea flava]NIN15688.1 hypothetical protein [Hydrotalea flava]
MTNLSEWEEKAAKNNFHYDAVLYVEVVLHILLFIIHCFLGSMQTIGLPFTTVIARIATMGLLCSTFGINVAHELGHRQKKYEQALAKIALLTSLYMHFFIEHNQGHHKWVATPNDLSSAPLHLSVYGFWVRSVTGTYQNAWRIANKSIQQQGLLVMHYRNEMMQMQFIQIIWMAGIWYWMGWLITCYYIAAAVIGFLLLETVNYIEHYGLQRKNWLMINMNESCPGIVGTATML